MRSLNQTRQEAATSNFQDAPSDVCTANEAKADFHHLHTAWVLAPDSEGNPGLRMQWLVD